MKKSIIFLIGLLSLSLLIGSAAADPQLKDGYYQIGSVSDLQWFANQVNAGHVTYNAKLTANIDLSGVTWTPIGTSSNKYAGTFDGGGHIISNLAYSTSGIDYFGLLFFKMDGATIRNIGLNSCSGTVTSGNVGYSGAMICILCGSPDNSVIENIQIIDCQLSISGSTEALGGWLGAGGISGYVTSTYTIRNCMVSGLSISISGNNLFYAAAGAIHGAIESSNYAHISNCYAYDITLSTQTSKNKNLGVIAASGSVSNSVALSHSGFTNHVDGAGSVSNSYAVGGGTDKDSLNGESITSTQYNSMSWWSDTVGFDFTNTWYWDTEENLPKLRGFSNIEITLTSPAITTLQDAHITAAVTSSLEAPLSYQWAYSTDAAATWTNISGQTADTLTFTPQTTGAYLLKVFISDETEVIDSYKVGFTDIKVNVLNTYTPQAVTAKTSSIQAKTSDNYQALQEFDFDANANISEAEWITNNRAYIAAGNAVYEVLGDTAEINPVAPWTGNTISKAYLGNTRAIINDIDNNVAVYTYATHQPQYITVNGSNVLAVTRNYAAVLQSGTLNIYNSTNQIQATVASTATNLAANDNTDIFAYYSGRTLYYYTISNNAATQHTATPVPIDYSITSLQQIRGTENWLITSEYKTAGSGTPMTYVVKILESGVTIVLESRDAYPLKHAQATESNLIIGTDRTTAYIIGADGITQGTYTTGGTLNDASISKSNGLYAIVGGQDNQAYFLNKYESSNWVLGQAVNFGETVLKTQISNDGTLALVGTANKFFLFKWDETIDSQYFINGVVVGSDGLPYANKYISIDENSILTDDSGFFVYPVKPGQTYTIITGSKTTRYTATNQALQTLSIKIQSQLIAQDVTYGASYNEQSGNIEMHYSDAVDKTSIVVWKVRDTKTGQTVYQQSVPAGQEAYYFVPEGKQSENYFVSVEAERGNTTVKNTWSITPSGQGQFVNLFGMDDTGKNILFGFFLILLAGLFGYLHQHIGTIIIAFAAAVLRYLGLITVPWIMILIAIVVSIVAAIAHRGEGR